MRAGTLARTVWLLLALVTCPGLVAATQAPLPAQPLACPGCTIGVPYFETVAGSDQVGNGIITVLAQDRRGLLWFGTPEGLVQFDGYRMKVYRNDPADPGTIGDDYVRGLLAHSDGSLWVATQGGGVSVYDPASDRFRTHRPDGEDPHGLPGVAAVSLIEGAGGEVWIGLASQGLARWDPPSGRFQHFPPAPGVAGALQHDTVRCLLFDRAGNLWAGTGNGLHLRRHEREDFEHIASDATVEDSLARQYVYALFEASDGRIWVGTQSHGLAIWDPATSTLQRIAPGGEGLGHPWVSGMVEPAAGRIWVATYGAGIDVVDAGAGRVVQRLRADPSIPGSLALDRLTAPFRDRSGLIWMGSWGGGLQRHNPHNAEAFTSLRHGPSLPRGLTLANVLSTLPVDDGRVWVGTGGNGIDVIDLQHGLVAGYRPDPRRPGALRDGTIRAMLRDRQGRIWVGTQQSGLQRYQPESDDFSASWPGLPRGPIRRLHLRSDGRLLIGMQAALVLLDPDSGELEVLRTGPGREFTDAVWSLAEDGEGDVWIGTPLDLMVWRAGSAHLQAVRIPGLRLQAATDLAVDRDGRLWLAGPRGLLRMTGWSQGEAAFEDYGARLPVQAHGLGQLLLFDDAGGMWTPRARIDTSTARLEAFGPGDGVDIGSVEIGSGSRGADGRLYLGGTRGLLVIDPARYRPWNHVAPLLITALAVDGQALTGEAALDGVVLQPGQRRLSIEFAALDYSDPTALDYAYRLVGLDQDWIETDWRQRLASFHNLWPGNYRFELRARSRHGEWSEQPVHLDLRVVPAWWQTPLALAAALLALLLLIGGAMRLRTLRMQQQARELEALVAHRTEELSRAKERAELALAELKGAQKQLVAAEKMASLGQLVAGVAHEINTPIGIAVTAASHLHDIAADGSSRIGQQRMTRSELESWKQEVEAASRLVLGSLERASTLVASFKQVSVDQSSGQRRCFLLHQFLQEVQTALNPTLRRTPHQLEVDCPPGIEMDSYPGALFQIFGNLINNAVAHAFDPATPGLMRVRAWAEGELLVIEFSDDGAGMEARVAAHAFDPFFTTRRGSGGSGLGLHVVHNLVTQLLGGSIEMHSAPGQGTRFHIRFARRTTEVGARPGE